jgi:hypothetical protein
MTLPRRDYRLLRFVVFKSLDTAQMHRSSVRSRVFQPRSSRRPPSGGGPGFTGLAYRGSDHRLSFAAGGKGLFVQSETAQCGNGAAGLDVKQSDRIDLGGFGDSIADSSAIISPAQQISSP